MSGADTDTVPCGHFLVRRLATQSLETYQPGQLEEDGRRDAGQVGLGALQALVNLQQGVLEALLWPIDDLGVLHPVLTSYQPPRTKRAKGTRQTTAMTRATAMPLASGGEADAMPGIRPSDSAPYPRNRPGPAR